MAQDLFQIALEHHRAGRVRQAEAGYRAVLGDDPAHADGLHWLGVLYCQAGRPAQAMPLLQQAAELRPADAAFQHNLGQAALACGQIEQAVASFTRAAEIEPANAQAWLGLGLAHLRSRPPAAVAAVRAFEQARSAGLDSAEIHHHLGVALLTAGRSDDAIGELRLATEKGGGPDVFCDLAAAHCAKGDTAQAQRSLWKALDLDPEHVKALYALAAVKDEAGQVAEAQSLRRRADRISGQAPPRPAAPASAPADPVADLEQKLTLTPAAADLHFALASQLRMVPPAQAPTAGVAALFDNYADRFDEHLRNQLHYQVPELIVEAIRATHPDKPLDTLDLGCGTGLCGPLLRPLAGKLSGVDLSAGMIEKARARNVYDHLEAADMIAVLRQAPRAYDLLVAADVFVYVGDLAAVFEAATTALRPGGLFAFSVEAGAGDRYEFQKNRRFTHSKPYVQRLAAMYGFKEESFAEITGRHEADRPVAGYLVVLRY